MDAWIAKQHEELRRIEEEGSSPDGILAPFHDALVPGIRGLVSAGSRPRLEISTSGLPSSSPAMLTHMRVGPTISRVASQCSPASSLRSALLNSRRAAAPDHTFERQQLLSSFGAEVDGATRIDLSIRTKDGDEHYFEMKSAKPNKGQCIEMKQRLLTALGIRRSARVFVWWGVPYNPYGTASAYAHPYPLRYFDFKDDVKLGLEFWNFVGDDAGTFELLLDLYRQVGLEYTLKLDELRAALAGRAV